MGGAVGRKNVDFPAKCHIEPHDICSLQILSLTISSLCEDKAKPQSHKATNACAPRCARDEADWC